MIMVAPSPELSADMPNITFALAAGYGVWSDDQEWSYRTALHRDTLDASVLNDLQLTLAGKKSVLQWDRVFLSDAISDLKDDFASLVFSKFLIVLTYITPILSSLPMYLALCTLAIIFLRLFTEGGGILAFPLGLLNMLSFIVFTLPTFLANFALEQMRQQPGLLQRNLPAAGAGTDDNVDDNDDDDDDDDEGPANNGKKDDDDNDDDDDKPPTVYLHTGPNPSAGWAAAEHDPTPSAPMSDPYAPSCPPSFEINNEVRVGMPKKKRGGMGPKRKGPGNRGAQPDAFSEAGSSTVPEAEEMEDACGTTGLEAQFEALRPPQNDRPQDTDMTSISSAQTMMDYSILTPMGVGPVGAQPPPSTSPGHVFVRPPPPAAAPLYGPGSIYYDPQPETSAAALNPPQPRDYDDYMPDSDQNTNFSDAEDFLPSSVAQSLACLLYTSDAADE